MLNIVIVHGNDDGTLKLEVNGHPNNGNNEAKRGWDVHWRVDNNCNVERIHEIRMKTGPGAPQSTNIFSQNPPKKQDAHSRHWKAKVNIDVKDGAAYNYDIIWVPKVGGGTKTFDPKITVMPDKEIRLNFTKILLIILSVAVGLFSLEFLRKTIRNR